jgi:hypothetical protein
MLRRHPPYLLLDDSARPIGSEPVRPGAWPRRFPENRRMKHQEKFTFCKCLRIRNVSALNDCGSAALHGLKWHNLKRSRGPQILVVRCPKSGRGFGKYGRETLPGPGNSLNELGFWLLSPVSIQKIKKLVISKM